ncbi:hypothetical protein NPIL_68221 [Nephila pilipes]|uniref:Uncharacterized protein n=1 Tax=Nephila pilipes TaxID=299642 RepID=A0A8X6PQD0_NEPPI|nr:hypothetical protein NPIL_68221 [Nephila pilipes]
MERYRVRSNMDLAPSPDDLCWTEWNDLHALGVRTRRSSSEKLSDHGQRYIQSYAGQYSCYSQGKKSRDDFRKNMLFLLDIAKSSYMCCKQLEPIYDRMGSSDPILPDMIHTARDYAF